MLISRDTLRVEYERLAPLAEQFRARLTEQLNAILLRNNITPAVPIESRIKSVESIQAKVEKKQLEITAVEQMSDLVGIRIILLFPRDVHSVRELIKGHFQITDEEDALARLGDSQFGYQSIHLQLKLPNSWLEVPTFKGLGTFSAEIQIRTVSQHLWAAASHKLQYKRESGVPLQVRRSINRVAALLETVDLELERTLGDKNEYKKGIDLNADDEVLNVDLLQVAFDSVLSPARKDSHDPIDELLDELNSAGIKTLGDLKKLIRENLKQAEAHDKIAVERFLKEGELVDGELVIRTKSGQMASNPERIRAGVWKTRVGLVREMLSRFEGLTNQ